LFFSNEWEEFPRTYKWKDAINFIKERNMQTDNIKEILRILINEGNMIEDEALTVAVLESCLEENKTSIEELSIMYGEKVAKAVELIIRKTEETFENYIERVFNINEFKYIRKIIVAKQIYNLRKKDVNDEIIMNANKVLKYKECTHRELMKKLEEEVESKIQGG